MFNKHWRAIALLTVLSLLLAACGGETPTAAPTAPAAQATNTTAAAAQATDTTAPAGQATNTTAAAGQATNTTAPAGQATNTTAPAQPSGNAVTIKVFAQQGAPYKLESNSFTQEVQQKFNVK